MQARSDLRLGAASHVGPRHTANEDDLLVFEPKDPLLFESLGRLLAVADGVSGARGGAEASRIAIRAFCAGFLDWRGDPRDGEGRLRAAFQGACQRVYAASLENPQLRRMGTTLTVARVCGHRLEVGHVGDSRCVLVRDRHVARLTEDHAAERDTSRITRCIGGGKAEERMDYRAVDLRPGDRVVLCTDGLWSAVDDAALVAIVSRLEPERAAGELVREAIQRGSHDNISVVVCGLEPVAAGAPAERTLTMAGTEVGASAGEPVDPLPGPARWPRLVMILATVVAGAAVLRLLGIDLWAEAIALARRLGP